MKNNVLIVIPARGGSKGIPRKNLRTLAGKPLIYYSIQAARSLMAQADVYVTTDDEEIAAISEKFGAQIIFRDPSIAQDATTLDPVIFDAYRRVVEKAGWGYDYVVTLQPTSPLLKSATLDEALHRISSDPEIDTIISACIDTHLTWSKKDGGYVPNYIKRVNRQYLDPVYKETGGFLITKASIVSESNRIGRRVELHLLKGEEGIDIDTYEDWNLCEFHLKRKKILFVVAGYHQIGLGHVYNTLLLANDILKHQIEFLVDANSKLAFEKIASKNFAVRIQSGQDIIDDIRDVAPDVVINDRLDTDEKYIMALKGLGVKVINFEDLGAGARYADLVINAIYPEKEVLPRHYFGHDYIVLRDEFLFTQAKQPAERVYEVLLTFGGVDPNNLTEKVLRSISEYCREAGIKISVMMGFGYSHYDTLKPYENVNIHRDSMTIADMMARADIVFTSAGRTTYEVASLRVPTIVLAQNERELTHFFASAEHGFLNLGLGALVEDHQILDAFVKLVVNRSSRQYMSDLMAKYDLVGGRRRTLKLINEILEEV